MKKKNGFTLVELIAAITILGVLLLIGSQVVIDTMNKNKAKAVYTSMDNVSKQARLTFLDDQEAWYNSETDGGVGAIRNSVNYNEKDTTILRDNGDELGVNKEGGSRVVCLEVVDDESKFKNLKFEYFINNNDVYCSYDVNNDVHYHFEPRGSIAKEYGGQVFKSLLYEKDDYIFYLKNSFGSNECINENAKNAAKTGVDDSNVEDYTTYEKESKSDAEGLEDKSPGRFKLDDDDKKEISKVKIVSICKVFISENEYKKYRFK